MLWRWRGGHVQLQPEEEVRRGRRKRVLEPIVVRQLGRHPHDRSRLPHGRERLAEWPLRFSPNPEVIVEMVNCVCNVAAVLLEAYEECASSIEKN